MQIEMLISLGGENLNLAPGEIVEVEGLAERFGTTLTDEQLAWALCNEPAEDPRARYVGEVPERPDFETTVEKPLTKAQQKKAAKAAFDALTDDERRALESLTPEEREQLALLAASSAE